MGGEGLKSEIEKGKKNIYTEIVIAGRQGHDHIYRCLRHLANLFMMGIHKCILNVITLHLFEFKVSTKPSGILDSFLTKGWNKLRKPLLPLLFSIG